MLDMAEDSKMAKDLKEDTLDLTTVITKIEASVNENKEIFEENLMA